jgi:hypothetical protein
MATPKRPPSPPDAEFRRRLRAELPRLLLEDAALRRALQAALEKVFPSRAEVAELRALREDFNRFAAEVARRFEAMDRRFVDLRTEMDRRFEAVDRRFEAMDRRFEAMDQRFVDLRTEMDRRFQAVDRRFEAMDRRFEAMIAELRSQRLHLARLSGRLGHGLEHLVRGVVEEFAGKPLSRSERLILRDGEGEVFGVPADIEFDLLASDGETYLCEVKSHIEPDDVLRFHRKAAFAAKHLGRPFTRLMIGASMEAAAEALMTSLGVRHIVRARIEPRDADEAL